MPKWLTARHNSDVSAFGFNLSKWGPRVGCFVMFVLIVLVALTQTGCGLIDPKETSPISGEKLTADQLTAEYKQAEKKAAADAKIAEIEQRQAEADLKRELAKIQREATAKATYLEGETAAKIDNAAAEHEKATAVRVAEFEARKADLEATHERVQAALTSIQNRQAMTLEAFGFIGDIAKSSGLPGGGAIAALLAIPGYYMGRKKGKAEGDLEGEKKASTAHDEAWDESKRELVSLLATLRGVSLPEKP